MSRIWIILILFLISSTSANPVINSISLDKNGTYSIPKIEINNSDFKGEPSYNIEVQASNSRVNTGDNYSMNIFISGVGDAKFGKIRVNIPDYIVEDETIFRKSFDRLNFIVNHTTNKIELLPSPITLKPQTPGFDYFVGNMYFTLFNIDAFLNIGETIPLTINFTISPNAPGGDHNIYLTLFYKLGDKWYTSSHVVSLHINRWYEKDWMQGFVFISLLAALAAFFLQIISLIQGYRNLKRRDEKDNKGHS